MTTLTPPSSWAERIHKELLAHPQDPDKYQQYITCCLHMTEEQVHEIRENAEETTYSSVRLHCDIDGFIKILGYVRNKRSGLTLKNDAAVSFCNSWLTVKGRQRAVIFINHSGIEWVYGRRPIYRVFHPEEASHESHSRTAG